MWYKHINKMTENVSSGIDVTVQELIDLRSQMIHYQKNNITRSNKFQGQKLSRIRGRGIAFDTIREYQPGDDIRSMAWRVTARSLKPYIKVYQEEKDRPVWLALDLSPNLFFGTRCMFKSVSLIKQAAFLGWSHLHKHERIGAMFATTDKIHVYKPQFGERNFLTILNALSEQSRVHPKFNEDNYLHQLLVTLQQQTRSSELIFILSDFFHFDTQTQKILIQLAQRAQVILFFVYDPFEAESPEAFRYVVTNGEEKVLFNMENSHNRLSYQQQFKTKLEHLIQFSRTHNITLHFLRTDQKEG